MTAYQTQVIEFPPQPAGLDLPQGDKRPAQFVETSPLVGRHSVQLTYIDADLEPRIQMVLEAGDPHTDWWRGVLKRVGDTLPPLVARRAPLLPSGPYLLP